MLTLEVPRYRLTRRPFDPSRYDAYLDMYGDMYGDMSDPVKRADTVRALRRRDAFALAAARRTARSQVEQYTTGDLLAEARVKLYQINECADLRPWNVREEDIRTLRMIVNELHRRASEAEREG